MANSGEEKRKHRRFTDRSLANMQVTLVPVPPLYGEPATGFLADLSAGGMALVLHEILPKKVFLKMTLTLMDGTLIESVVQVRRVLPMGRIGGFLHGIEFLNPSPEAVEKIESMADNCLQRKEPVNQPTIIQFEPTKKGFGGGWEDFKNKFETNLKKAA